MGSRYREAVLALARGRATSAAQSARWQLSCVCVTSPDSLALLTPGETGSEKSACLFWRGRRCADRKR